MDENSYNFLTIRLWATKGDNETLRISVEPEIIPGFAEKGTALFRFVKALTQGMRTASESRSEEEKILNRAEIRALCSRLDELHKSGENLSGKSPIRPRNEEIGS